MITTEGNSPPPAFDLYGPEMVVFLVDFNAVIVFTSSLSDLSDSELDSSSDSESELFLGEGIDFVLE